MSSNKIRRIARKAKEKEGKSEMDIFREKLAAKIDGYTYRLSIHGTGHCGMKKGKEWDLLSSEDKVKKILKDFDREKDLPRILGRFSVTLLKAFYEENFPYNLQKKDIGQTVLISEINCRFFERKGDLERRSDEKMNIELIEGRTEFQFVTLCEVLIPIDVLIYVFSFLKYDNNLPINVGRVSKVFYVTILASWPHFTLDKENIFKVSVLVLKSVRSVTFSGTLQKKSSSKSFLVSEIKQGVKYFSFNRLRKLVYHGRISEFVKFLNCIDRMKNKDGLKNVTKLKFDLATFSGQSKKDFETMCFKWKTPLIKIFPKLLDVEGIVNFDALKGLFLYSLNVDRYSVLAFAKNQVEEIYEAIGQLGTPKRDQNLQKNSVRKLSLGVSHGNKTFIETHVPNFLKGFTNLESLNVTGSYQSSKNRYQTAVPISFLIPQLSSTLVSLTLQNYLSHDHWYYHRVKNEAVGPGSYWGFHHYWTDPDGISSLLPNVRTLIVESEAGSSIREVGYFLSSKNLKRLKTSLVLNYPDRGEQEKDYEPHLLERIVSQQFFENFESVSLDIEIRTRTNFSSYIRKLRSLMKKSVFDDCSLYLDLRYVRKYNNYRPKRAAFTIDLYSESRSTSNGLTLTRLSFLKEFLEDIPRNLARNGITTRISDYLPHSFWDCSEKTCSFFSDGIIRSESLVTECCCVSRFDHAMKNEKYSAKKVTESDVRRIVFSIVSRWKRKMESIENGMEKNETFVYEI